MGLDTTHDCWHGAYSAFSRWRNAVTVAAGIPLKEAEHGRKYADLDWDKYTPNNLQGQWSVDPDDILLVLIAHSDCDGWIMPNHARPLADRLEELLPKLRELDASSEWGHIARGGGVEGCTLKFILGLRNAAENNEPVGFY